MKWSDLGGRNRRNGHLLFRSHQSQRERLQPQIQSVLHTLVITDIAPGHISIRHGFRGMNFATVSACASSTNSLIDALNYIRLGKAAVIVAGGSEACVAPSGVGGFNAMHALSVRNDDPKTASRPFDKDRDGFVLGEGGACLIVRELEHALTRRANIYAELAGGGLSADAHHLTAPHPEGLGAEKVMERVLSDAGVAPEEVDYINVHGTSTPLGDVAEIAPAIQKVFTRHAYDLNISSTKSMTGHLFGCGRCHRCHGHRSRGERRHLCPSIVSPMIPPWVQAEFHLQCR